MYRKICFFFVAVVCCCFQESNLKKEKTKITSFFLFHTQWDFIWSWPLLSLFSHLPWKLGICFFISLFLKKMKTKIPISLLSVPPSISIQKIKYRVCPPPLTRLLYLYITWLRLFCFFSFLLAQWTCYFSILLYV